MNEQEVNTSNVSKIADTLSDLGRKGREYLAFYETICEMARVFV